MKIWHFLFFFCLAVGPNFAQSLDSVWVKEDTLRYQSYQITKLYDEQNEIWVAVLKKGDEDVFSFDAGGRFKEWTNFGIFPLVGKENSQLIVEQFSGGAHCCWTDWIIDLPLDSKIVYASEDYPVGYGLSIDDLDQDGTYELIQTVLTFDYFDRLPHALSPLPAAVFKFDVKSYKYLPASNLYPEYLLKDIDKEIEKVEELNDSLDFKTFDDPHGEYLSSVLEVVLDYIYAGKQGEAWSFYETEYRMPDKYAMKAKISETLEGCSIYRYIYGI